MTLYFIYLIAIVFISVIKARSIWKGVCGGNGIPQPQELLIFITSYAMMFEFGAVIFNDQPANMPLLGFMFSVVFTQKLPEIFNGNKNKK